MSKLTEKQQNYANLRAAGGVSKRQAAILAGYAENSADVQAAQLERRKDIQAAIRAARKAAGKPATERVIDDKPKLKDKYPDAKSLMEDVMNNPKMPLTMRYDAAKLLLPYHAAKIGETGKKDKAKERAGEIANGKTGKFQTRQAPKLKLVGK